MREKSLQLTAGLLAQILSFSSLASTPAPYFTKHLPPTQRVFIENIQLSAKDFFLAYMSKTESERRYAELYLLGVLDATEGSLWCDYKKYKTETLAETIYLALKDMNPSRGNERASRVITETLTAKYPCKEVSK